MFIRCDHLCTLAFTSVSKKSVEGDPGTYYTDYIWVHEPVTGRWTPTVSPSSVTRQDLSPSAGDLGYTLGKTIDPVRVDFEFPPTV